MVKFVSVNVHCVTPLVISVTAPCCPDQTGTNRPPSRLLQRQRSARQHTCRNTQIFEITAETTGRPSEEHRWFVKLLGGEQAEKPTKPA